MRRIKLDASEIISQVSGFSVADTYDGFFYENEDYIKVVLKKDKKTVLYNFVNESGKEISKVWFKQCGKFKAGMVPVTLLDGTQNILTSNGQLLLRKNNNYISIKHYYNGFFIAQGKDKKYRLISRNGKQIKKYFDYIMPLGSDNNLDERFILVEKDYKWNIIGKNGEYLLDKFFINANQVKNIFDVWYLTAKPKVLYHKFVDIKTGKVILEGEYLKVEPRFAYNCFLLKNVEGQYNVLNSEGKLLFDIWYDKLTLQQWNNWDFVCFYAYKKVKNNPNEILTMFDLNGNNIVNNIWFDKIEPTYSNGYLRFNLAKNKYMYIYDSKSQKLTLI